MADDGHSEADSPASAAPPAPPTTQGHGGGRGGSGDTLQVPPNGDLRHKTNGSASVTNSPRLEEIASLTSPRLFTPNPFSRKHTSLEIDDYFTGPRDIQKHSKWPLFLRMHGSILPKLILPLLAVGAWTTLFTCISQLTSTKLYVDSVLLTVLGFVVSLSLSFRNSTAYERYAEGRRYWAQLILATQNLGRVYWVHSIGKKDVPEAEQAETRKRELLERLTAMNLLVAFSVALKHRLRFEPYTNYDDISSLVSHLNTFALAATRDDQDNLQHTAKPHGFFKSVGEYLGVSFAESNPRKAMKRAGRPLGNLPLEILSYLGSFTDELALAGRLPVVMHQTTAYNNIATLNDVLVGTERVLNTPLPIAYAIAVAQITWVYILVLPFQLLSKLNWITIPATVVAAYIILGLLFIGREIENPFGHDVNDLPLEGYCAQVAAEMDLIASHVKMQNKVWVESDENRVLWPLSTSGWPVWMHRNEGQIREAVLHKVEATFISQRDKAVVEQQKRSLSEKSKRVKQALSGDAEKGRH